MSGNNSPKPNYKLQDSDIGLTVDVPSLDCNPYRVDFQSHKHNSRLSLHNLQKELLIKAIGGSKNVTVLDATAGLGRDGILLAKAAERVILLERHPDIYQLLKDGLERLRADIEHQGLAQKVELHHQCAIRFLQQYQGPRIDIIYCDPMFPPKRKSALNKKESQILQAIVGQDIDNTQLIDQALLHAQSRVVVKRPLYQEASPLPDIQFKGRAHRFDVYLTGK